MGVNCSLTLPLASLSFGSVLNEGWSFTAEFIKESIDFISINTEEISFSVVINGTNIPTPTFFIENITQENHRVTLSGCDKITHLLKENITGAEHGETCQAVLLDMAQKLGININYTASSRACNPPGDSEAAAINILQDYSFNFGTGWKVENNNLYIFDYDFNSSATPLNSVISAVLTIDNNSLTDSISIQETRKNLPSLTISNTSEDVLITKKLVNPNAPQENITADENGAIHNTNSEEQDKNLYPADVWIDPWTKTLQRLYAAVSVPYFKIPQSVQITEGDYKTRYITGAGDGWEVHFFDHLPTPEETGSVIFSRKGQVKTLTDDLVYARIQRTITVSTGRAIEFPHVPAITALIVPKEADEIQTKTYPETEETIKRPDTNVITSAAYNFQDVDTINLILPLLYWQNNINSRYISFEAPILSEIHLGQKVSYRGHNGLITAFSYAFPQNTASFTVAVNPIPEA